MAQPDAESRTGTGFTVQGNRSTVAIQYFLDNGHADPGAGVALSLVQSLERVEQLLCVTFVKPDAVVAHHQGPALGADVLRLHGVHRWPVRSVELDGVAQQILEYLA